MSGVSRQESLVHIPRLTAAAAWVIRPELVLLAAAAVLPFMALLPLLDDPVGRDEAAYLTMARGLLDGELPYRDLFDHKPPLTYAWYALSLLAFGDRAVSARIAGCVALGATVVLTTMAAKNLYGSRAGMLGGAAMSLACFISVTRPGFNSETFMLPWMAASTAAFAGAINRDRRRGLFLSGLFAGIAICTKTVAATQVVVLVVAALAWNSEGPWSRSAKRGGLVACGALAVPATLAVVFIAMGAGREAFYANFTYNRLYAGSVGTGTWISGIAEVPIALFWMLGPLFTGAAIAVYRLWGRPTRADWLVLGLNGAALAGIVSTGHFFLHYYLQLMPSLALLIAAAARPGLPTLSPFMRRAAVAVGLLAIVPFVRANLAPVYFQADSERLATLDDGPMAARMYESPGLGDYLRERLPDGETLFNFGRDTQIHYYAGVQPRVRYFYDRPYWLDPETLDETLTALRADPPFYIVDTIAEVDRSMRPAAYLALLEERYELEAVIGFADVWRRK